MIDLSILGPVRNFKNNLVYCFRMKKILFVVNIDWFFESHRLEIAKRAMAKGYEVHVACKNTGRFEFFEDQGMKTHQINFSRSDTNIFNNINTLHKLNSVINKINPDICHFITVKPVIFGGLISVFNFGFKPVFSVTGLGSSFLSDRLLAKVRSYLLSKFYSYIFRKKNSFTIFQNTSDIFYIFRSNKSYAKNFKLIAGSGVDLQLFKPMEKNFYDPLKVVMASRALSDKGVSEYFKAADVIKNKFNSGIDFSFYGDPDPENPTSLTLAQLKDFNLNNAVNICGFCDSMHEVLKNAHILILPSYREGFPKIVMEASACGCISIVTDVPGCRDAILPGKTGFLVEKKSVNSIVETLEYCMNNRHTLPEMSNMSRIHAESNFSIQKIVDEHLQIYSCL
jgi:glycosyltransferase involved in cell wall biosynthesis